MVSHHHPGNNVSVRSERAVRGADVTELDSVYKHHPLPSMPRFMTSGVQSKMAADSMLAYTERMRELSKARNEVVFYDESPRSVLEVRAQHIPKFRAPQKGVNPLAHAACSGGSMHMGVKRGRGTSTTRTRPRSLDELIGRPDNPNPKEASQPKRRFSVPAVVPSLAMTSVQDKGAEDRRVRISFVSAADLFDLVDFSLRSKQSRNESIKLAKAEGTLQLLTNASLLKTISPRPEEESPRVDPTNLLMVKGSASPREAVRRSDGEWAEKELQPNSSFKSFAGVKQSSFDDTNGEDILDLFRDAHALSQSSHKLKTRPKRAKRMKLYRSHLSAIPEDEHQNEQSAHAPELPAVRMPVVPTSSSLAAIKGTRSKTPSNNGDSMEEIPRAMHTNSSKDGALHNTPTKPDDASNRRSSPRDSEKPDLYSNFARTEEIHDGDFSFSYSPRRHNTAPRGDHSVKKANENSKSVHSARPQGSNVSVTGAKVKAQKKFRKLIFLRDYPDQSYTRYTN